MPAAKLSTKGCQSAHFSPFCTWSITDDIGKVNGEQWVYRMKQVRALHERDANISTNLDDKPSSHFTDLTGCSIYNKGQANDVETCYDMVNAWQINYVRGTCALDGRLLHISQKCHNDNSLFGEFHAARPGAIVLDVGCNTGKNMTVAKIHGGEMSEAYGIEFNHDSVAIAMQTHGSEHIFQGDAATNFVDAHSWDRKFSVVQCSAVLQHMIPQQVSAALGYMARCLKDGGELLLTFKDAPTKDQMHLRGMGPWAEQVFTADKSSQEDYVYDGYLRAVMWDDDYYPGVTSDKPPQERDFALAGHHRREFVFYGLDWMKRAAGKHGLVAERVEVHPDSKIPFSALHWMVVFRLQNSGSPVAENHVPSTKG